MDYFLGPLQAMVTTVYYMLSLHGKQMLGHSAKPLSLFVFQRIKWKKKFKQHENALIIYSPLFEQRSQTYTQIKHSANCVFDRSVQMLSKPTWAWAQFCVFKGRGWLESQRPESISQPRPNITELVERAKSGQREPIITSVEENQFTPSIYIYIFSTDKK